MPTDKCSDMPEHKRLPSHGNLVCVEKINHLLVRDTNRLRKVRISPLSPSVTPGITDTAFGKRDLFAVFLTDQWEVSKVPECRIQVLVFIFRYMLVLKNTRKQPLIATRNTIKSR